MSERIQYDGDRLDEIVARGIDLHFEAMGWHQWWGCITTPDGGRLDFFMRDFDITESDKWPVEPTFGPDLTYACETQWNDRNNTLHQCEVEPEHRRHRCECGSWCEVTDARD